MNRMQTVKSAKPDTTLARRGRRVNQFGDLRVECLRCFKQQVLIRFPCDVDDLLSATYKAKCNNCGSSDLRLAEARAEDNNEMYPLGYHINA